MARSWFGVTSIQNKLIMNVMIFMFIPFLFIAFFVYLFMRQNMIEQNDRTVEAELNKTVAAINIQLDFYLQRSAFILTNSYLLSTLNDPTLQQDMEHFYQFQRTVEANLLGYDENQYAIYLRDYQGFQGKYISNIQQLEKLPVYNKIKHSSDTEVIWSPQVRSLKGKKYVTFYRNMTQITRYEAVLEVNIPYELLNFYITNMSLPDQAYVLHMNSDGHRIGLTPPARHEGKMEENFDAKVLNTEDYFINKNHHLFDGSQIIVSVPKSIVSHKFSVVLLLMGAILFGLLIVLFVASRFVILRMTRSLNEFISYIRANNNLFLNNEPINLSGDDEVGIIKRKFASIISQAREMFGDLEKERTARSELEMELLQARLNPHLLYNSLSVIKWSALKQGDSRTVEIVNAMSSYYRIALNRGSSIIQVSKELSMIEQYVKIVSFTHEYPYKLSMNVEPDMLKCQVLKHLLQPVVENAVLHGLNGKGVESSIHIEGRIEQQDLIFTVTDNGFGMKESVIEAILSEQYESEYGGYGLKNLMHRLRYYYGDGYGITLLSVLNEGTAVTIRTKKTI